MAIHLFQQWAKAVATSILPMPEGRGITAAPDNHIRCKVEPVLRRKPLHIRLEAIER